MWCDCKVNRDSGVRDEKVRKDSAAFSHENMKREENASAATPRPVKRPSANQGASFGPRWVSGLRPGLHFTSSSSFIFLSHLFLMFHLMQVEHLNQTSWN